MTAQKINNFGYAGVHILNAPYQIDKEYDYAIPTSLKGVISVGSVVVVPFGGGNRNVPAIVSSLKEECSYKGVKSIIGLPPGNLCIGDELYGLCEFLRDWCFCSVGEAAKTILPSGFSVRTNVYYVPGEKKEGKLNSSALAILKHINEKGEASEAELKVKFEETAASLRTLVSKGYLEKKTRADFKFNTKSDRYIKLLLSPDEILALEESRKSIYTVKQRAALSELVKNPLTPMDELMELCGIGESVLRELKKKNAVDIVPIPKDRNPYENIVKSEKEDFTLSEEQGEAYSKLYSLYKDEKPRAALLFGVTGSGKTNVVQKLVDKCISDGKSAIVLVPEIALTAQAVGIFASRYGENVAVLHSGLSAGERLDAWKRINEGKANVVLGTRSAVFAPVKNLGLLVIDEEQESSFKSDMTPKYHARDIARYRCAKNNALMLLCSATPSIESYYKAKEGTYTLVEMKNRYGNATLPSVEICDLRDDSGDFVSSENAEGASAASGQKILGTKLLSEIKSNLDKGEQSVLFINRRGYQSFLSCRKCGFVLECPNCSVSMTYHKYGFGSGGRMVCHYCGYTVDVPKSCPVCESDHMTAMGTGTQMLEEQLAHYFPSARLLRMDTDTTSGKFSHEQILSSFRSGEADILLGTQMVAKGHDFPQVSLVGVVNADASLHVPDFRANEKTFSLMTQVVGRAGRGDIPGRAVVQSYSPDHEVLKLSKAQDYESFYNSEIKLRRAASYPPFCDIVLINFTSETDGDVHLAVKAFGKALDTALRSDFTDVKMIVYGPFEAGIYKLAGRYRMRFVLKCANNKRTRQLLGKLYKEFLENTSSEVSVSIDINPQSL